MTDREQQLKRDRRLEAVAFLRDNDMKNKERLFHVNQILSGDKQLQTPDSTGYYDYKNNSEYRNKENERFLSEDEKYFWRSFRNRLFLAFLLTGIVYFGMMSNDSTVIKYISKIKTTISVDYSENLFDFINQIPYTLDYEKINVKG